MTVKEIFNSMAYGPAPESTKETTEFLDAHHRKFDLFINGKWKKPNSNSYFESINPSTTESLAQIAEADEADVNEAVLAAKAALVEWKKIGSHGRARYLYALARQIQKHSRLFSVLESMDNGKPIRETRDIDIPLVARHFYYHAGWAQLKDTELIDYKEVGVVGQIVPWNFPLLMLSWKIAPALAMGNTVVLKPAEFTSLTSLLFAEICQQVGLPDGVVNVVTGFGTTGAALVNHPDVNKIAFTGSTEVGKIIRKATAGSGKKLSLELGGKSPFIVFEDADLDSVVEGVVDAIWFNQGQVCCAGSRLLVQESIAEKLYAKIKARMETLRIGNSLDKNIDIGAIVAPVQLKTIQDLVKMGVDEGNQMWQPSWECPKVGCFYPPTLFTGVSPSSIIAQEEIFGPVLVAMTFRSHQEAVKLANNTRYGLACSLWTENINLALDVAPQIKAGTVWINCTNFFDAASGFGGFRESGYGREGGKEGLFEYVKPKIEEKYSDTSFEKITPNDDATSQKDKHHLPTIDKTAKLYIGGKQVRPDSGYSLNIKNQKGQLIGEVAKGNRKDLRNAVEAAHAATSWSNMTGHAKAQVLYYVAENLSTRADEFAKRISLSTGKNMNDAALEVELSIERIYTYAAYADKYDGHVHHTVSRNVTLAMPESIGVLALICPDEFPLLGFISNVIPAIAMGNSVVVVPSETSPLLATDFYQILETSDVPAGVVNIVTGLKSELSTELAKHFDVDGIWFHGSKEMCKEIENLSTENLKRTWVNYGKHINWLDKSQGEGEVFLRHATEIKNIWVPYGA
ncbi:MAG: aldehyde dehydrogenase family protein [Chitinophagaceae bacterium]|nr:aldehyde dehydrogenase family protein [Chitinophagaceae bacterium]